MTWPARHISVSRDKSTGGVHKRPLIGIGSFTSPITSRHVTIYDGSTAQHSTAMTTSVDTRVSTVAAQRCRLIRSGPHDCDSIELVDLITSVSAWRTSEQLVATSTANKYCSVSSSLQYTCRSVDWRKQRRKQPFGAGNMWPKYVVLFRLACP